MSKQLENWPYVINLGNSILGVSVLAMPFCFRQCGVLLGVILLLSSAWLTSVACELLMKSAVTSKKRSYEYLALHTFGPLGKLVVELSIIGMLLGTCVAFHVVIGDLGPGIISKILGIENTPELRTSVMVVLGLFVGLPLGLLKNIESLSNVSAISIGFYMVFVAEIFASSFPNLWSGIWVAKVEVWNPEGVFKCLPIFSLAFGCQTQLFVMYDALPEPSIKRMNGISKNAISLCTGVYLLVGFFGYVTFCDEPISGDILMNFRPTIFSEAVKLGFVMSIAVSFPLVIFPCRTSIHTLLFAKHTGSHENIGGSPVVPEPYFKLITVATVVSTLIVGINLPSIEFILAITGATMGSMICYIFPAVLFITLMSMSKNSSKSTAQLVLFLGVTILLASTYTTLYSQDQQVSDSKVKVAPQPIQPIPIAPKEDIMGAGEVPNVQSKENVHKDGDGVIKDGKEVKADKVLGDSKVAEGQIDDKRQEPPNPHAPVDDAAPVKDGVKEEVKINNAALAKEPDKDLGKQNVENPKLKREVEVAEKSEQDGVQVKPKVNATAEKSGKELKEAKVLLEELKEQRDEQKKLLDAQRELINELKQHQKDAHPKSEDQKLADGENAGIQQAGGVAPLDDGAGNVKQEVDKEVANVVKNAVDVQQEQQLHNIAKQNHQEMLESFDTQKQQQTNQVKQINAGIVQAQQPGQAAQQQLAVGQQPQQGMNAVGNDQQMGQGNVVQQQQQQQQPVVNKQQTVQVQQQQQPHVQLKQQQQLPVEVLQGAPQKVPALGGAQPQLQQQQQVAEKQPPIDTQDAMNYVHQQGFLPDHEAQPNNLLVQPVENVGNKAPAVVSVNAAAQVQPGQVQGQNLPVQPVQTHQQQKPADAAPNSPKVQMNVAKQQHIKDNGGKRTKS